MRNHLKRIASPRTWMIDRKQTTFTTKPKPGPHAQENSLPLGLILRDFLNYARTIREVKKMLHAQSILVDGKRRKDHRLPVGLFDTLSFPSLKENFRLLLDQKGRIILQKITPQESLIKPCQIINKTALSGKKLQLNLHDGKNLLVKPDFPGQVGDTLLLSLPDQKIKEVLELKKDAFVFLTKGQHSGESGLLKEIKGRRAIYQKDNQLVETLKEYLFVLGHKKSNLDLNLKK